MIARCLDEPDALAFVAGELPAAARLSIENHADECDACRELLAALVRVRTADRPTRAEAAADWQPGQRIGRYTVRERIGRGGMGTVYRADDIELGRAIALKRLHAAADADARATLIREARAAAALSHVNVVTVYEVGDADGVAYLAMELVDGLTLVRWARAERRSWRQIVAVLAQAGLGLAAAHACGLVHRDFKPDNVLVDRGGRARIADFGLARADGTRARIPSAAALPATTAGAGGTPAYLAPEVVGGAAPDTRSDQFAFAVALYETLQGRHPFEGSSASAVWVEMAEGRIRENQRDIPAWLDRLVRRGLATDPAARWPSVAALVDALEHPPERRAPWLAAALGIAVVAGGVAYLLASRSRGPGGDCEGGTALIDAVWSPTIRDQLTAQLAAAQPRGAVAIATSTKLVDDWADAWRLGRRAACRGEPAARPARIACLDRGLGDLRELVAAWRAADGDVIDRAVSAATALPRPDECAASATPPSHAPPELTARISELRALDLTGKPRLAEPKLAGMLADATATGDPETMAKAEYVASSITRELGDRDAARRHAARAAKLAGQAGDDAAMLDAIIAESELALDAGRASDALASCDAADAILARAKLDREDSIELARGDAYAREGHMVDAIAAFRRAIAILEARAARDRSAEPALARAYGTLGSALGDAGQITEGKADLEKCLAIEEKLLGPDHPEVGKTLNDLANQERELGQLDTAHAHLVRARAIFFAAYGTHGEWVGGVDVSIASLLTEEDKVVEARQAFETARAELQPELPPDHPDFAVIEGGLGNLAAEADHDDEAIAHFKRAVEISQKAGITGPSLAIYEQQLARVLVDSGRIGEARPFATSALAELEKVNSAPEEKVDAWQLLAECDHADGHVQRARALAKQALAALGDDKSPDAVETRGALTKEIAQWSR